MSLIGAIFVYSCTDCGRHMSADLVNEPPTFPDDWYLGVEIDLCPKCRFKLQHQATIVEEEKVWREAAARIDYAVSQRIRRQLGADAAEEVKNVH